MGVRGLSATASGRVSLRDEDELKQCHVLVDGPNFAYFFCQPEYGGLGNYLSFKKFLVEALEGLAKLDCRSVDFYFDGFLPRKKMDTRMERSQLKASRGMMVPSLATNLLLETLAAEYPNYGMHVMADEADGAIAYEAAQLQKNGKKVLIFSNDSDFFTYGELGSSVLISPLYRGDLRMSPRPVVRAVEVPQVFRSVGSRDRKMVRSPNESCLDLYTSSSHDSCHLLRSHEFLNVYDHYNKLDFHLPILFESTNEPSCWQVGKLYRSFAYTLLLRRYLEKKRKKESVMSVTEYYRTGINFRGHKLSIFRDISQQDDFYNYAAELESVFTSIEGIVDDLIREITETEGPGFQLDEDHPTIEGIRQFLLNFFNGKAANVKLDSSYCPDRQLFAKVLAAIYSLKLLSSVWPLPVDEPVMRLENIEGAYFVKTLHDIRLNSAKYIGSER